MKITKQQLQEAVKKTVEEDGLWDNIRKKRERGEKPAKPGDEDYPEKKGWDKAVKSSKNESATSEDNKFPFELHVTKDGKTTVVDKYVDKPAALKAKERIDPKFKPKVVNVAKTGGTLTPDSFAKIRVKESISNINLFSLIDEIVLTETGEGIIEDLTFTDQRICEGTMSHEILEEVINDALAEYYMMTEENLNEAEYKGRKVSLGKISKGDSKKYKVHVKNGKGNVVKVEFGDPNMEIKRDNPKRRKSFRARHHCENPGPRWKARYWACKTWSKTPVSKMTK